MREFLKRWAKARGGAAAMIFAVGGVVMVMCVGAGVDLSRQAYLRSRLSDAVDASALGLIGKTSPEFVQASQMSGDGPLAGAATDAWSIFNATMADQVDATVNQNTDFVVVAQKTGRAVTASVTATAHIPTYFMGMVGTSTLSVTSHASVENDLPTYQDYYLLLDNSPSMSIASTAAGIAKLSTLNPENCGFACHDQSGSEDYYTIAKNNNIATRINIISQSTAALVATAQSIETLPNQYRMAIATFGASMASIGYTRLPAGTSPTADPSTDLNGQQTVASTIDAMAVPYQNYNSDEATDFYKVMADATVDIPASGDGSSAATPQKVLFLVTDGVDDSNHGGRLIAPIDTTLCDAIKLKGIKIAIIYTTYLPLTTNSFYMTNVAKYQPSGQIGPPYANGIPPYNPGDGTIPGQLEACATSGFFFEVPVGGDLTAAMNALFVKTVLAARITS